MPMGLGHRANKSTSYKSDQMNVTGGTTKVSKSLKHLSSI